MNQKIVVNPSIVFKRPSEDVLMLVSLDDNSHNMFKLTGVHIAIFDFIYEKKETTSSELLLHMLSKFEVEEEVLKKDLEAVLENFKTNEILLKNT